MALLDLSSNTDLKLKFDDFSLRQPLMHFDSHPLHTLRRSFPLLPTLNYSIESVFASDHFQQLPFSVFPPQIVTVPAPLFSTSNAF